MLIKSLTLYTSILEDQKNFYGQVLGFKIIDSTDDSFSIQTQVSKLTFKKSDETHLYHYCFLIPGNSLQASIEWLAQKNVSLLEWDNNSIHHFDSWNADSIYFYDGAGNLAEFIVRHDLNNNSDNPFGPEQIINVNEIGMPTEYIRKFDTQLEQEIGSEFWKGDFERFGTHGSQEGLFLLPNPKIKNTWFPTEMKIKASPFESIVQHHSNNYSVRFVDNKLSIQCININ